MRKTIARPAEWRGGQERNMLLKSQRAALCAAHENFQKKGKGFILERVGGIEPPATAWKAVVLPLYDTRLCPSFAKATEDYGGQARR